MPFTEELFPYITTDVFFETGTFEGHTIDTIVNNTNCSKIISLELSNIYYTISKKRFENNSRVSIYNANSKNELYNIIKNIDTKITFWLDAHWSGENMPDIELCCPLLMELNQIKKHHINNHTIIIDDMRLMTNEIYKITKEQIIEKIMEINSMYKIIFMDDETSKNDILIAYI